MTTTHDHAHDEHAHPGLEVEVERTGPCLAQVTFRVSSEEFDKTVQRGLSNVARRTKMKGFRPGKTPRAVVEKQFGEQVAREAVEHFLNHAYDIAVKRDGLRPAAHPRIDIEAIDHGKGKELTHRFEVHLRPTIELGECTGLVVESKRVQLGDEELDAAIEELRRQRARPEPAGDEGLAEEGLALCRLKFLLGGTTLLDREGVRLGVSTPLAGVDPKAYADAMKGAKVGETRELPLRFPQEFPDEMARGKEGTARVELTQVFKIVLPEDAELYALLEAEDAAGFRESVRQRVLEAKERAETARIENELIDRLLEAHPMELPEALVEGQAQAKVAELRKSLEDSGAAGEELEQRLEQEERQTRQAASKAFRAIYLIEEIAKKHEVKVEREDLQAELRDIAERNQASLEEVRKYYQEEGLLQQLALELLERKVRSFLRESADIRLVD